MLFDVRNNPLTGANPEDVPVYNDVLQAYMEYRASAFKQLKALCVQTPEFAMAHLFKGYLLLAMGTRATIPAAQECARHVETLGLGLTPEELLHLSALKAWANADTTSAVNHWEQILDTAPHDLLAFKLHHFALFWLGESDRMLKTCERIADTWSTSVPGYGQFLGARAFALEECGHYQQAEQQAKLAIELDAEDLWSLHALTHVYEMQGRLNDGITLLDRPLNTYNDRNPFRGHLWWHLGMFLLEKGSVDQVIEIYDNAIHAEESGFYLDIQNTASILARLEFSGVNVGDRWQVLATSVQERIEDHVLAFTEPHHTAVLARSGDQAGVQRQLDSLNKLGESEDSPLARLTRSTVLPLCAAVADFYRGDFDRAEAGFAAVEQRLQPTGGSHAQRDLFHLYRLECSIKNNNHSHAESLLKQRLIQRPQSGLNWRQLEIVSTAAGDTEAALHARKKADAILAAAWGQTRHE